MTENLWIVLGLLVIVLAGAAVFRVSRGRRTQSAPQPSAHLVHQQINRRPVASDEKLAELAFGPSEHSAALRISAGDHTIPAGARRIEQKAGSLSALGPVLQAAPSILTAVEVGRGQYMKVTIDGSLAAVGDGSYLPFVRGPDGRVVELARLHDPAALSSLVSAAAVWQLATIVVAQKHLADITHQLKQIRDVLDDVVRFQRDGRRSQIVGAVKYFQELAEVLGAGEVVPASRQKLEDLYGQLTAIQVHLQDEIASLTEQIAAIEGNDRAGSGDLFQQMEKHNERLVDAIGDWHQCVNARLMSWYLLMCYAGEHKTKEIRLQTIQESVEAFAVAKDGLAGISEKWQSKIAAANAFWNLKATLEKRRGVVRDVVSHAERQTVEVIEHLRLTARKGAYALASTNGPIELAVRLGSDGRVQAWVLPEEFGLSVSAGAERSP